MKKNAVCFGLSLVCATGLLFAQENGVELSFSNEIGSDIVNISDSTEFAGIYNEVVVDVASDRIEAGVDAKISISEESIIWNQEDFDWYVNFKPIEQVSLLFHSGLPASGSYLAVEDDNTAGGNMGSDGVSVAFTGVSGLTLSATLPFDTLFEEAVFGVGAEYNFDDKATISVVVQNILDSERVTFGVYGSLTMVENLGVWAGYSYNDEDGLCDVAGKNLVNVSAAYEVGGWAFGADYITSGVENFYAGLSASYAINDAVSVSLAGTLNSEYEDFSSAEYVVKPAVVLSVENVGEFGMEADLSFAGAEFGSLCFPVYWKYSF